MRERERLEGFDVGDGYGLTGAALRRRPFYRRRPAVSATADETTSLANVISLRRATPAHLSAIEKGERIDRFRRRPSPPATPVAADCFSFFLFVFFFKNRSRTTDWIRSLAMIWNG